MGLKYQNVSKTIDGIHAKVEELRKQLEPEDVHIVTVLDRGDLVEATVSKIGHTLLEGIGLVVVVLMLFLGSPRSALVVAVTIPLGARLHLCADERRPHVGEHALARRARLRHHRRRRDRRDREHPAPARGEAERVLDRGGRALRDQPGGAADLLRDPDHHHGLFPAVHADSGARRRCSRRWLSPSVLRCSVRCCARWA